MSNMAKETNNVANDEDLESFDKGDVASYRVDSVLGQGGFGVVRSGVRLRDGLPVAIKSVPKTKVVSWHKMPNGRLVPREIALLQHLRSERVSGVLCLLDFTEHVDSFELVLQRPAWSQDLFDFITTRGWLEETLARDFLHQIVDAVLSCQRVGVLHRDIKDENVVVDLRSHRVYLIDFGSGHWWRSTHFSDFDGTRVYAPPEFISEGKYKGEKATVWSLGILLHDMVVGDVPFETDQQICKGHIALPKHLSTHLQHLIDQCLQRKPEQRIALHLIHKHPWMNKQNLSMDRDNSNGIPIPNSGSLDNSSKVSSSTSFGS